MPIVLTEAVAPPTEAAVLDREALVQKALAIRPDLLAARIGLETDDLSIRQISDALRPQLNLTGSYSVQRPRRHPVREDQDSGDPRSLRCYPVASTTRSSQCSLSTTRHIALRLNLTLPLRDRAGAANLANALVQKKSDTLSLRSREQSVRLDVLNAITALESSRESVKLSIIARDLAAEAARGREAEVRSGHHPDVLRAGRADPAHRGRIPRCHRVHQLLAEPNRPCCASTGTLLEERGIVIQ